MVSNEAGLDRHARRYFFLGAPQPPWPDAYPYADLVETNRRRTRHEFEYELLDTGIFNEDPYFDVFVEVCEDGTEETNHERLFRGQKNESPYVKGGINEYVIHGTQSAVNAGRQGTKVAAHYRINVA